jgi:putative Holliday junction resolvase
MDTNSMHPALGIDYGDTRIGVAATDAMGILAYPVETIDQTKVRPIDRIIELARQKQAKILVLGLPVRLDGTEGTSAEKVRIFGNYLHEHCPELPLVYVDECLSTVDAQAKLHAAGKKVRQQRAVIDQAAAVEILNRWMGDSVLPPFL